MEILTPREFKKIKDSDHIYLEDYLAYLESARADAEESLKNAQSFLMDESVINSIETKVKEILEMISLVEKYMGQVVLKSLDTLTGKELQDEYKCCINFDDKIKSIDEKKDELKDERNKIQAQLDEVEKQIEDNLYLNGRKKDFYEIEDVAKFFSQNESPFAFLEKILNTLKKDSSLETTVDKLRGRLTSTIETECKIQNIKLSSEEITELCDKIMELFNQYRNIMKYSSATEEQLSKTFFSETGIKQVLPDGLDVNNLISGLMNHKKINTLFFSNLPDALKERLVNERLRGEEYNILLKTYQAFLQGKELPADDLSQEEKEKKNELEEKLKKVNTDLDFQTFERESLKESLVNEEKMRSYLKEIILEIIGDNVTAKDIDSIIKPEETKMEKLKADLSKASSSLPKMLADLSRVIDILNDEKYHDCFERVALVSDSELYSIYGVNVTEEVVLPFLEEEKRRNNQIDIMISLQNELSNIYNSIKSEKAKNNRINKLLSHFIKSLLPDEEKLKELDEQYQKAVQEAYKKLKEKNLFCVNAPRISEESTVGNVIILPSEEHQIEPADFSEISGLKQTLWNMSSGIDENTKRAFLAKSSKFDNWNDYYQDLVTQQAELINKLFSFEKGEDGYYSFSSSIEERELLKSIQTTIIDILSSVYEERKALRKKFEESSLPSSLAFLEGILNNDVLPSRQNLAHYVKVTKSKIDEYIRLLTDNRSLCITLGITIPEEIIAINNSSKDNTTNINDSSDIYNKEVEEKIQELKIEGVNTLKEAIRLRGLLQELEEYTVPATRIRKYHSEHKR